MKVKDLLKKLAQLLYTVSSFGFKMVKSTNRKEKQGLRASLFWFLSMFAGTSLIMVLGGWLNRNYLPEFLTLSYSIIGMIDLAIFFNIYFFGLRFMVNATPADKSVAKKMLAPFITTPPGDKMDLYLIPSSKKINAIATGILKKNIFITEDALSYLDEDEIHALVAHELGHHNKHHLFKHLIFAIAYYLSGSALLDLVFPTLIVLLLIPFIVGYFFILGLMAIRFEYQSDEFAKKKGYGKPLVRTLEKLASYNRIPLKTSSMYNIFHLHPSISDRIAKLNEI